MIKAKIDSDLIRLAFRYNPDYIQRVKMIPYRRYDPETRTWSIPRPQWRNLTRIFKDVPIQIPKEQTCEFRLLDHPHDIPLVSQIRGFKGELRHFQAEGVGFLITRRTCLLADDLGLGKTVMSIAAALELRNRGSIERVLVFCPKTIIRQWVKEYKHFTGKDDVEVVSGNRQQRKRQYWEAEASNAFFVLTNYATVLREAEELLQLNPDVTILDEVTRIKNYRAKTTRQIKKYFRTPYKWALSGTPMENRLAELYSIMEWVDPGILGYWSSFRERYLIYGGYKRKEIVGHRNLPHLHSQLQGWMLRRRKRDVLPELPDVTVNNYYVTLSTAERRIYKTIHRYIGRLYKKHRRSGLVLKKLVYLRECCDHPALVEEALEELGFDTLQEDSSKLDELKLIIDDFSDRKIVVYSEWVKMLHLISEVLRVHHVILHGGLSQKQRDEIIHSFTHEPDCQILLSSDVGEQGLNLQAADIVINYELHWTPSKLQQRVGRLCRIGQKNTVTCINLIAEDTIEEHVLKIVREKTSLFRKVIDGDFSSPAYQNIIWQILDEEFGGEQKIECTEELRKTLFEVG